MSQTTDQASATPPRQDQAWQRPEAAKRFRSVREALPYAMDHLAFIDALLSTGPNITRFLDVGSGDGFLSAHVMQRRRGAHATLVDFSEPMLHAAQQRMDRDATVLRRDLADSSWCDNIGPVHAVISGFAIHHLPDETKRRVYSDIHELLAPGGWFVHLEHVASATPIGTKLFEEQVLDAVHPIYDAEEPGIDREAVRERFMRQPETEANILAPVWEQCDWLRAIGFTDVDCFFKSYEVAIFGGRKAE